MTDQQPPRKPDDFTWLSSPGRVAHAASSHGDITVCGIPFSHRATESGGGEDRCRRCLNFISDGHGWFRGAR